MAQKLYKWTGDLIQPDSYDSAFAAPKWYGTDEDGVGYAFLDVEFAKLIGSSNDDVAVTTASDAKTFVKTKSRQAKELDRHCREDIRKSYSLEDELKAYRTDDSTVKTAIANIVSGYATKKNALVGD